MLKLFMRACVFTGFHSLFLGFCHISGSSARFPLFFGCFSDFCGVFYDFLPLCSFQAKNRLFSAFIGFPRLFLRVFASSVPFPYNRAFDAVLTDFFYVIAAFYAFTLFYRSFPYFSRFFEGFIVFRRISPVFCWFSSLRALFYVNIGLSAAINVCFFAFYMLHLLFPRFRGIVARSQSFAAFYPQFTLLYRFSDNSPVFAQYCAFFCKEKDGTAVPSAFYAI